MLFRSRTEAAHTQVTGTADSIETIARRVGRSSQTIRRWLKAEEQAAGGGSG